MPEALYWFLHITGETYEQIGSRFGITKSAVLYWLKKFRIPRKRGDLFTERELSKMYLAKGMSLGDIGALRGVGAGPVKRLCKKARIPIKPSGWANERYIGNDGHSLRSSYEKRVCDWLSEHAIEHEYEPRLLSTSYHGDFFAGGFYIEIWGVTGSEVYNARKKRKIGLYNAHGMALIQISKWRFSRGTWHKPLARLLDQSGTTPRDGSR